MKIGLKLPIAGFRLIDETAGYRLVKRLPYRHRFHLVDDIEETLLMRVKVALV
jgi:hypothetical protein